MEINELTEIVIGCAIEVHRNLGPGLLESAYQECLFYELKTHGLYVEREINLPIIYKEIKTVEKFTDVHTAQILTYMRLGDYSTGLLINFNTKLLKEGIKRFKI